MAMSLDPKLCNFNHRAIHMMSKYDKVADFHMDIC